MRIPIVAFCLFTTLQSIAQDPVFAPLGATWYYRPWGNFQDTGLYVFTAVNDTIIDNWNARMLRCSVWADGALHPEESLNKYVALQGEKVYYRVAGEFVVLFDFDAQPGDTIASRAEHFPIFDGCNSPPPDSAWDFRYKIDSVGIVNIDGTDLRIQYTSWIYEGSDLTWGIGGQIIERIGAYGGGQWWGTGSACILAGSPGYLRCYTDNDLHYQPLGSGSACDYVSVGEQTVADLKTFPNPAASRVFLPFLPDQLFVFNILGQNINIQHLERRSMYPRFYRVFIKFWLKKTVCGIPEN